MGGGSVVPILICRSRCVLLMLNYLDSPRGWKLFVISWSRLCSRAELLASSLEALKHSRSINLSPRIVCRVFLISTSMVAKYVETVAFSIFSVWHPRIPLYEKGASTIKKSRCRVYPTIKGRVMLPRELMLRPINPTREVMRGSYFFRRHAHLVKGIFKKDIPALSILMRIRLMMQWLMLRVTSRGCHPLCSFVSSGCAFRHEWKWRWSLYVHLHAIVIVDRPLDGGIPVHLFSYFLVYNLPVRWWNLSAYRGR